MMIKKENLEVSDTTNDEERIVSMETKNDNIKILSPLKLICNF
jgi:hypothetical protein